MVWLEISHFEMLLGHIVKKKLERSNAHWRLWKKWTWYHQHMV